MIMNFSLFFFFSSRRRHTRLQGDWSSDVCSSDLRANFFNQKYGVAAVFRQIPTKILTAEQLGLPSILKKFAMLNKGLVLVTGPTGSGKSTTLAAIVDHANKTRRDHIITV